MPKLDFHQLYSKRLLGAPIENLAKRFRESIKNAKKNKGMFSVPYHIDVFREGEKLSIIDYSILILRYLMENDANVTETGKNNLRPLWLEMSNLVSKGNDVSTKASKVLPVDIMKKREDYLSNLKQIVCDSIENDEKDGVTIERDNEFYCVKCPEESVITPGKFLSNPEFQNLDGALEIGEGDIIRIQNGQYHDMKGKVKMTFKVGDDKKIEVILSSENASSFGKIMVHMDEENCEIFSEYCKELEKEPCISKVVEAAKSFVQMKNSEVSPPPSALENVQHSQNSRQELPAH